jgi:hypothetical protein
MSPAESRRRREVGVAWWRTTPSSEARLRSPRHPWMCWEGRQHPCRRARLRIGRRGIRFGLASARCSSSRPYMPCCLACCGRFTRHRGHSLSWHCCSRRWGSADLLPRHGNHLQLRRIVGRHANQVVVVHDEVFTWIVANVPALHSIRVVNVLVMPATAVRPLGRGWRCAHNRNG